MIDSILEPAVAGEVQQRLLVTLERLLAIRAPTAESGARRSDPPDRGGPGG